MRIDKVDKFKNIEFFIFIIVYALLFINAYIVKDSWIALVSAFCGISYTIMAGKGIPACYLIGVVGSFFYSYLSFKSALWGNLLLYAGYYIPMQVLGFFRWNKHLKPDKNEIVKIRLTNHQRAKLVLAGILVSCAAIIILIYTGDKSPYIDGVTTIFSIFGMYLTVKRAIEQWVVWIIVNALSLIMWLKIALSGVMVYSTVIMWAVYLGLAFYFYMLWTKELNSSKSNAEF